MSDQKNIKSINELANIAKANLYFTLLSHSAESLKQMEDEDGWSFLHYYFALRMSDNERLESAHDYQLVEIQTLKKLDFDFYKLAKNNKFLDYQGNFCYEKKEVPDFNALTPFHIMLLNARTYYKKDIELVEYLESNFSFNIEDSSGLSPLVYNLIYKNLQVTYLLGKINTPLLTKKMLNEKELIFNLIEDAKERISETELNILKAKVEKEYLENAIHSTQKEHSKIVNVKV